MPPVAFLLVLGKLPPQQLPGGGTHGGTAGIHGHDGKNFFVYPFLYWLLSKWRPDIHVHLVVESAEEMRTEHADSIKGALGILDGHGSSYSIDAPPGSLFARRSSFFTTFHSKHPADTGEHVQRPPSALCRREDGPTAKDRDCDPGWVTLSEAPLLPMGVSENLPGQRLRADARHYAARNLFYNRRPAC